MCDVAVCPCGAGLCLGAEADQQEATQSPQQLNCQRPLAPTRVSESKDYPNNDTNMIALDLISQIEQLLDQAVINCPCGPPCGGKIEVTDKCEELVSAIKLQYPIREIYIDRNRVHCPYCQKRFPVEKLDYHKKICLRFHQKRKAVVPYSAKRHRLRSLSKSNRKKAQKTERPPKLTEIEWKEEHEEWKTLMTSDLVTKKETLFKDFQWRHIKLRHCKTSEYLREKGIISCPI